MYDIIIIGAGPAGLTAAIYARRASKNVLVLEAKRRKAEKLRAQGCTNPWMVITWGHEPKFKKVGEYNAK